MGYLDGSQLQPGEYGFIHFQFTLHLAALEPFLLYTSFASLQRQALFSRPLGLSGRDSGAGWVMDGWSGAAYLASLKYRPTDCSRSAFRVHALKLGGDARLAFHLVILTVAG